MIRATIVLDSQSRILFFEATGHAASGDRGYDIVCAAFSVLSRTAYRALETLPGIELRGSAPEPGSLNFEVLKGSDAPGRAAGIADFLVVGMGDLARDYPEAIELVVKRDRRE